MQRPGWLLLILGLVLAAAGPIWVLVPSIPWIGRLPGDIVVERENFRCLVFTLLFGPAGLLMYFAVRMGVRRNVLVGNTKRSCHVDPRY